MIWGDNTYRRVEAVPLTSEVLNDRVETEPAAVQLLEFGVPEAQIEISNLCTVIHNHAFFSARKGDAGRFAAGIVVSNK